MKLEDFFELQYCINLDRRKDRWEICKKEFKKINLHPKRFKAIENIYPPAGCRESHLTILKKAQEKNKNVLIFEDDIETINYDPDIIEAALDELATLDWDMFYLGGNILRPFYQKTEHLAKLNHCQSTHAYGVNKNFLGKLIPFIENNPYIVDVLYADGIIPHNNCYIIIPMMAIQRADYSDIEKRHMNYSIPIARYNHFLVKKEFN